MKKLVFVLLLLFTIDVNASSKRTHELIQHGVGGDLILIVPIPFYEISLVPEDTPLRFRGKIGYSLAAGKVSAELAVKSFQNKSYLLYVAASGVFIGAAGGGVGEIGIEFPKNEKNEYWRFGILYGKFKGANPSSSSSHQVLLPTLGIGARF